MIKISNGSIDLLVTKGAFKSIYEPTGWRKVGSEEVVLEEVATDELPQADLMSIPIDEMTGPQLKQVAEGLGIVTQNKSKDNVKKEVKKAMGQEV